MRKAANRVAITFFADIDYPPDESAALMHASGWPPKVHSLSIRLRRAALNPQSSRCFFVILLLTVLVLRNLETKNQGKPYTIGWDGGVL
jgi:hypothetical protein